MDQHMRWNLHINNVVKKTRYLLFIFAKLNKIMDLQTIYTIYSALFNSVAGYGILVWGSAYQNAVTPLLNLQNRISKVIQRRKATSRLQSPLNIKQMYVFNVLNFNLSKLRNEFHKSTSRTRAKTLRGPKIKLEIGKKSHVYQSYHYFNALPHHLKIMEGKQTTLRNHLKNWVRKNI